MDEILINNFMVFHDAIEEGEYDLVIGDELGCRLLPPRTRLKRTAFAWMTDFVGWLPMPMAATARRTDRGLQRRDDRADRALPRVRDRAIFVGDPDDIVRTISGRTCRPFAHGPRSTSPSPGA